MHIFGACEGHYTVESVLTGGIPQRTDAPVPAPNLSSQPTHLQASNEALPISTPPAEDVRVFLEEECTGHRLQLHDVTRRTVVQVLIPHVEPATNTPLPSVDPVETERHDDVPVSEEEVAATTTDAVDAPAEEVKPKRRKKKQQKHWKTVEDMTPEERRSREEHIQLLLQKRKQRLDNMALPKKIPKGIRSRIVDWFQKAPPIPDDVLDSVDLMEQALHMLPKGGTKADAHDLLASCVRFFDKTPVSRTCYGLLVTICHLHDLITDEQMDEIFLKIGPWMKQKGSRQDVLMDKDEDEGSYEVETGEEGQ